MKIVRIENNTKALGPGNRAVIWVYGCSRSCKGCIAKEMNTSGKYESFTPIELFERISTIENIEGITISGGEPFEQPLEEFLEFLELIRKNTNFSVMCYTGNTLDELRQKEQAKLIEQIFKNIDILVDGRYEETLNNGVIWRGSSNQKLHFLTDRYSDLSYLNDKIDRKLEFHIDKNMELMLIGTPPVGFVEKLTEKLNNNGIGINKE